MKTTAQFIVVVTVFSGLLMVTGCKKDNPVPITEVQAGKLSKQWKLSSVSLNDVDQTDYFSGMSLQIVKSGEGNLSYTVQNRPHYSPWPADGILGFGSDAEKYLVRDRGTDQQLLITYSVTASTLQLNFTFSGDFYNARTSEVNGQWTFYFGL